MKTKPKPDDAPEIDQATRDVMYGAAPRPPTWYEKAILVGLQGKPHVYGGTVDPAVVARRRRRNKTARKSRRINRTANA
jgi:hypothetical protein